MTTDKKMDFIITLKIVLILLLIALLCFWVAKGIKNSEKQQAQYMQCVVENNKKIIYFYEHCVNWLGYRPDCKRAAKNKFCK